ncbi:hypothetical protein BDN70DRAFT_380621 [Pholiota conissans]|uniref:Uncharacterized protein n=1 Tax=Pholiota conissans TaxID=109636 RepID=A0A9P5Z8G5_9AGAR|nr:hypothetical protein BDN70DRAFT_380621 [Pholiota conissans]
MFLHRTDAWTPTPDQAWHAQPTVGHSGNIGSVNTQCIPTRRVAASQFEHAPVTFSVPMASQIQPGITPLTAMSHTPQSSLSQNVQDPVISFHDPISAANQPGITAPLVTSKPHGTSSC